VVGATPTNWGLTGMQEWLSTAAGGTHIASFWAAATELSFFVTLTDGQSHQFALYGFAGGCYSDSSSNIQTVDILDAATDTVLDTRILTPSGQYLVWSLKGNIRVRVSHGRCGIAVNGVFFE
jgi:hypothetical protein